MKISRKSDNDDLAHKKIKSDIRVISKREMLLSFWFWSRNFHLNMCTWPWTDREVHTQTRPILPLGGPIKLYSFCLIDFFQEAYFSNYLHLSIKMAIFCTYSENHSKISVFLGSAKNLEKRRQKWLSWGLIERSS